MAGRAYRIAKKKGRVAAPRMPPRDPEQGGSKKNPPDSPISQAARRLRSEFSQLFSPGLTEYSKRVYGTVTKLFTKSITKTETNKLERVDAVGDLALILKDRFDDVMEAEEDHRKELERIKQEDKELEKLSQELGVYDIPEKLSFEKKKEFMLAVFEEKKLDSERSTKRQTHERVARRSGAECGKDGADVPMYFETAPTGGGMRWQ